MLDFVSVFKKDGQEYPGIPFHTIMYIIKNREDKSGILVFSKVGKRNISLEKILSIYIWKTNYPVISSEASVINFAGCTIRLGNLCWWRSPNNTFCNGGQVSWSVFNNSEHAVEYIDLLILKKQHR